MTIVNFFLRHAARGIEAKPPATGEACAGDVADSPTRGACAASDEAARPNVLYSSSLVRL